MTEARVTPGRDEVDRVARLLADIDADSKRDLRHYLAGATDWRMVNAILKRCIRRLVNDPNRRLRVDHRVLLLEYASKYGLRVGNTKADEPMTEWVRFKVTPAQKDAVNKAAATAGHDLTTWARNVVMKAAEG